MCLLFLQKPYVGATRRLDVAGVWIFQGGIGGQPTKTAKVVLDDRLQVSTVVDCTAHNIVGIKVSMGDLEVGVLSIYLEGNSNLNEDLPRLRDIRNALKADNCLIAVDVNAKSS